MLPLIRLHLLSITMLTVLLCIVWFLFVQFFFGKKDIFSSLPSSFLQMNTIFLSILIEAIPFVLIGVVIAGFIQIFVREEHIKKWLPQNRFAAVLVSCIIGAFFPACECGIVPIVRRLVAKGVPIYAGVGFLLTGPLINPIVIFSTYIAFGQDIKVAGLRMAAGFLAALLISFLISLLFKQNQLKERAVDPVPKADLLKTTVTARMWSMLTHSIDEFFDMGKYLVIGAFLAAFVQTYVAAQSLLQMGESWISSTLVMMGLAYILSLCSEADAFIGASFRHLFPSSSILAFLIYGPMIDLKNTLMLLSVFRLTFVISLIFFITAVVFLCTGFLSFL
ncbi:permease [Domibacillus robiginosus]|uniref:permease n=1 Tax=Domibacillus robiginosus TaxID=1071054 RepID=UPI00067AD762|nr:permease [Domibacillus robiginosus]